MFDERDGFFVLGRDCGTREAGRYAMSREEDGGEVLGSTR